jgi:hypothetical protein
MYVTHRKDGYVLRKLQGDLHPIEIYAKAETLKINEDKTRAVYFS